MVDPQMMCNQHLLGEHVELHMVVGALAKGYEKSVIGLVNADLLELEELERRHEALATEMTDRGMNHQSPLTAPEQMWDLPEWGAVDREESQREMWRRCLDCRAIQRSMGVELGLDWIKPITHREEKPFTDNETKEVSA